MEKRSAPLGVVLSSQSQLLTLIIITHFAGARSRVAAEESVSNITFFPPFHHHQRQRLKGATPETDEF